MPMMRAAVYRAFGPPSVIHTEVIGAPVRKAGQILIRVACASVNPVDYKIRWGVPAVNSFVTSPRIPGMDVAGVVVDCDAGGKFKTGDKVFGICQGATAEYAVSSESMLCLIPANVSFAEAAGVPTAALTAWQSLEKSMPLKGKQVLVHGGAGGVGSFAVQIAKAQGAIVTTTCSTRNLEWVTKTLGADYAVDYTKETFEAAALKRNVMYDHITDVVGGDYEVRSRPILKRSGNYANVLNNGWLDKYTFKPLGVLTMVQCMAMGKAMSLFGPGYSIVIMQAGASRGTNQVAALMAAGKLKSIVDREVPMDQAAAAHAFLEEKHARGKVIIKVADL